MSFKTALAVAVSAGLVATSAAAPGFARSPEEPAAKAAPRQCFWTRQVNNFASDDDRIVNLRVGVKDVYQLEMFGPCHDIDWAQSIAIRSRGSSYICSGFDAEIFTPSTLRPQRCQVSKIRKLTAEEANALSKRAKP